MKSGIIVYNKHDYNLSSFFCDEIIKYGLLNSLNIKLYFIDDLLCCIDNHNFYLKCNNEVLSEIDFVINRTRDKYFSIHLNKMNVRTYNQYEIVTMSNDKALTHQCINALGVDSVETSIQNKHNFNVLNYQQFPYVVKSLDGHGGKEVFKVESGSGFNSVLNSIDDDYVLIQQMCNNPGVDIRVFIMANKIYHCILRENKNDFKSNYTLGGSCSLYELSNVQISIIQKILDQHYFDFAGIDFIFDKDGNILFNEIEDVVGCRTLYQHNIDVARDYVEYIYNDLK